MRLMVISIGRLKQGPERELSERYRERFDDIGRKLGFRGLEINEIPESRARDAATRINEEAAAISAAIPAKSVLVALDERGDNIDSAARFNAAHREHPSASRDDRPRPGGFRTHSAFDRTVVHRFFRAQPDPGNRAVGEPTGADRGSFARHPQAARAGTRGCPCPAK